MPFYEYQCKNCGHELEAMQKVSDAPLRKCPHCGKSQLERLMSAPVFRLKGAGWYETDFKNDKDKKRNLADHPEAAAKEPDTKADAKPAESKIEDKAGPKAETAAPKPAESSGGKEKKPVSKAKRPAARRRAKPAARARRKN